MNIEELDKEMHEDADWIATCVRGDEDASRLVCAETSLDSEDIDGDVIMRISERLLSSNSIRLVTGKPDVDRFSWLRGLDAAMRRVTGGAGLDSDEFGPALIAEEDFEDWVRDYADDGNPSSWPSNHIDWAAAADEMRDSFCEFHYDGTTYLIR